MTPPRRYSPILRAPEEVRKHIGEIVTLEGVVENTKWPSLLGVLVSDATVDNHDPRNRRCQVTGLLEEWTECWPEGGVVVQGAGDGTRHLRLVSPDGGEAPKLTIVP